MIEAIVKHVAGQVIKLVAVIVVAAAVLGVGLGYLIGRVA